MTVSTQPEEAVPGQSSPAAPPSIADIARIWQETLGGGAPATPAAHPYAPNQPGASGQTIVDATPLDPTLDLDENFFEAGGTSLLAARLAGRLKAQMGCVVSAADILAHPSIRALAQKLGGTEHSLDRTASDQRAAMQRRAFSGVRPVRPGVRG